MNRYYTFRERDLDGSVRDQANALREIASEIAPHIANPIIVSEDIVDEEKVLMVERSFYHLWWEVRSASDA